MLAQHPVHDLLGTQQALQFLFHLHRVLVPGFVLKFRSIQPLRDIVQIAADRIARLRVLPGRYMDAVDVLGSFTDLDAGLGCQFNQSAAYFLQVHSHMLHHALDVLIVLLALGFRQPDDLVDIVRNGILPVNELFVALFAADAIRYPAAHFFLPDLIFTIPDEFILLLLAGLPFFR